MFCPLLWSVWLQLVNKALLTYLSSKRHRLPVSRTDSCCLIFTKKNSNLIWKENKNRSHALWLSTEYAEFICDSQIRYFYLHSIYTSVCMVYAVHCTVHCTVYSVQYTAPLCDYILYQSVIRLTQTHKLYNDIPPPPYSPVPTHTPSSSLFTHIDWFIDINLIPRLIWFVWFALGGVGSLPPPLQLEGDHASRL